MGILLLAGTLVGCGSSGQSADSGVGTVAEPGALPVTIQHRFGSTTVTKAAQRIAVVGYSDQDFVLAFGAVPVLARKWADYDVQSWEQPQLRGASLNLVDLGSDSISPEKVAAVKPDLIIGVYSGMTQRDYDALSKIAPVIAQKGEYIDYGQPWQEVTKQIGAALGQPTKADQLVRDVDARFAAARAANPQWANRTVSVATFSGNELSVFGRQDSRSRFFHALGFTTPAEYDRFTGEKFFANLSLENARILDQDLLVWDQMSYTPGGRATITANPAFAVLAAMRDNRAIYLEGEAEKAFAWQTVLSLPIAIDAIVSQAEHALPKR
ncbi:ABC transporter substrate-binding protein [Nocardia sp. CDC159]|uniref:ABC transporter substrate-binding protein n=1 Tax=Nocardia pulmonis TaxID=2951408 RepID=A0A9X2IVM8_9NOCA|nr:MULTISPECIES: ABC transporter substrate-binding protein [Nocardia]MCM6771955.1 ABC transporter substrate-binding protein [Nocardia pulmonis]MCM6785387.1 ABC transporter substrate-binding protein [Nocardia sp. CDC159]